MNSPKRLEMSAIHLLATAFQKKSPLPKVIKHPFSEAVVLKSKSPSLRQLKFYNFFRAANIAVIQ